MVITHIDVDFTSNTFTFEALFLFGVGNYMRQQVASYNKNYVALELCLIVQKETDAKVAIFNLIRHKIEQ